MRMCSIASGSSGNSIYIGSGSTHILIDAGISGKRIEEGLHGLDLSLSDISAIFITHEHSDHIKGIGVLARKAGIPIYATKGTIDAMLSYNTLGSLDRGLLNVVSADSKVCVGDLFVCPMRVSHDAAEPVAYRVLHEKCKISVITDLGCFDDYTLECLKNSNIIMAEANHDVRMLQVGPYPYYLKQRILSDRGHLSNETSGRMISALLNDNVKEIILGHLSAENNIPELAYESVRLEIEASDTPYHGNDFPIRIARRDCPLSPIEI